MKKINIANFETLNLSDLIFKYPISKGVIEKQFDPKIDTDFEKYMLIKKDNNEVRLSKKVEFLKENSEEVLSMRSNDLLDGTWWILP